MARKVDPTLYEMAFKVLAKPQAVSRIIGPRGSNVIELRQNFGVEVHVQPPENCFPRTDMQVVVLLGSPDQIIEALGDILPKLLEVEQNDYPGKPKLTVYAAMTQNAVSMVIGNAGATVKELKEASNCNIYAEKDAFLGEQLVKVTGTPEDVPKAFGMLVPFASQSSDSIAVAVQEYGQFAGGASYSQFAGQGYSKGGKGCQGGYGKESGHSGYGKGAIAMGAMASGWASPQVNGQGVKGAWGAWHDDGGKGKGGGGKGKWSSAPAACGGRWGPYGQQLRPAATVSGELSGEPAAEAEADEDKMPQELDPNVLASPASIAVTVPAETVARLFLEAAAIKKAAGVKVQIEPGDNDGTVTLTGTVRGVHRAHCLIVAMSTQGY